MKQFDAQQELAFIKAVMEESRRKLVIDGTLYIVWGIVISVGMLATYALLEAKMYSWIGWTWVVCIGFGWIFSIMRGFRQHQNERVRSLIGKLIAALWIGTGITMTLIGFIGTATGFISGMNVIPLMAMILGIPYLVSGIMVDNWLISKLAFGWWLGGVAMMIWPGTHIFFIFALMMVLFQILPGIVLRRRWKKEISNML